MNAKDLERKMRARGGFSSAAEQAAGRLVADADEAGLLDVAYAEIDSPFGPLIVAATRRGLVRLAYPNEDPDSVLSGLALKVSPRMLEAPAKLDDVRRQLEAYFEGKVRDLGLPVDYALTRGFVRKVLRATARIPYGQLSTYRLVATRAGSPRASRAAGNALGANPIPIVVPCHRVVHSSGGLGGYTGGLERKEFLLELEGALG
jgi:methylated-DNA-[protein]-cysteine S-methyltransferase